MRSPLSLGLYHRPQQASRAYPKGVKELFWPPLEWKDEALKPNPFGVHEDIRRPSSNDSEFSSHQGTALHLCVSSYYPFTKKHPSPRRLISVPRNPASSKIFLTSPWEMKPRVQTTKYLANQFLILSSLFRFTHQFKGGIAQGSGSNFLPPFSDISPTTSAQLLPSAILDLPLETARPTFYDASATASVWF